MIIRDRTGRAALLLAFGEHPGENHGISFDADRNFFKSTVLPFLEEQVIRCGKKAFVIHEYNVGIDLRGFEKGNAKDEKIVSEILMKTEEKANNAFSSSLNAGLPLAPELGWFDWGYAERIAQMNKDNPGAIRNIVEPLKPGTAWHMWEQSVALERSSACCFSESVEIEIDMIRRSIEICLERSRRVVALVKAIREADPHTAIVVPRGFAHRGMSGDFDYSEFEMQVSYNLQGVPLFSSEAIIESFGRKLGEEELRRYAMLSLHYEEYIRTTGLKKISRDGLPPTREDIRGMWVDARKHALETLGVAVNNR